MVDLIDEFDRVDVAAANAITDGVQPWVSVLSTEKLCEVATGLGLEIELVKCARPHSMSQAEAFDTVFGGVSIPQAIVFFVADVLLPNAFASTSTQQPEALRMRQIATSARIDPISQPEASVCSNTPRS